MTDATQIRNWIRERESAYELLRRTVQDEALPAIRESWAASPGRIEEGRLLGSFLRVGQVERRTDEQGTFDLIWLEYAAYRPFDDDPNLLLESRVLRADEQWLWNLYSRRDDGVAQPGPSRGVVWLRECGRWLIRRGYAVPWLHCGINQRRGDPPATVDRLEPDGDVEEVVFPAAREWLKVNGGPVYPAEENRA